MSQGLDFPGAAQGRKRRETARRPHQEKCHAHRELCPREQDGQRAMDAHCGSPAAAGLPREFQRRKTCGPGGRARE